MTKGTFIWFCEGVDKVGFSRAAVFNNLVPVFATLMAVFVLHEKLYLSLIIGAGFVISGIFLTNYQNKESKIVIEAEF